MTDPIGRRNFLQMIGSSLAGAAGMGVQWDNEPRSANVLQMPDVADFDKDEEAPVCIEEYIEDDEARVESTIDNCVDVFLDYSGCEQRQTQDRIVRACYNAEMGFGQTGPYQIREIFRELQTLIPQITKALFGEERLFTFKARYEGFSEQAAAATAIVEDQVKRFGSEQQLFEFTDNYVREGSTYMTTRWQRFRRTRYKLKCMSCDGEKDAWDRESYEVTEAAPFAECLSYKDCFHHPSIEDAAYSPMFIVRKGASADDLKTLVREGYLDAKVVEEIIKNGGGTYPIDIGTESQDVFRDPTLHLDFLHGDDKVHEMLICWTFDGRENVVVDREYLPRAMPLEDGKIPIYNLRNYGMKGRAWGLPEAFMQLGEQRLLDEFMRLYVDSVFFQLNPMWRVSQGIAQQFENLTFNPGKCVIGNQGEIEPLPVQPVQMALQEVATFLLANMMSTSGITQEIAGTGSDQKTATGLVRLQAAASDRIQHKIRMAIPVLRRVYRSIYNLNARNLDDDYAVRVAGENGGDVFKHYRPKVFEPADVDCDVEFGGGTGLEEANSDLNAYKIMGQDPLSNRQAIIESYWRARGKRNVRQFLANPANSLGDAVAEEAQLKATGLIADPKANDNHMVHFQHHMAVEQGPDFKTFTPDMQMRHHNHTAIHGQIVQQMMQMQAQAQQASTQPMENGSLGVGNEANLRTETMMQNGQRGAQQAA